MARTKQDRSVGRSKASLLSSESMGGIVAGKGFDFQTRYAACHLPLWLADRSFMQLFFEGTGDIDIHYEDNGAASREHIQIKDHEVGPAEFKRVLGHFRAANESMSGVYTRFTMACPSLSPTLKPLENALKRVRGAKPFYADVPSALNATVADVDALLTKLKLSDFSQFIHDMVYIEIGYGDLCHDQRAVELFVARLLDHPEFKDRLRSMVQPAFAQLMNTITSNKGTVLTRNAIEQVLRSSVISELEERSSIVLWIQNWTKEVFSPAADYSLDWSQLFDRTTRTVPSASAWNTELLPQLQNLKKTILSERTDRNVVFRGKCALSTAFALGSTFPSVGGWSIRLPQPPATEEWSSDAPATKPYEFQSEHHDGDLTGDHLVVALNIKGDGRGDVVRYVEGTNERPRLFVYLSPPSQGGGAIAGAGDAVAFAEATRDHLSQLLKQYQLRKTRLFYYGPFALAVFLGQKLTSIGDLQLYEYQDPSYVPSVLLKT